MRYFYPHYATVNRYLHQESLRREIQEGLNVIEQWNGVVARPSTVTGAYYNRVSSGLFENVNKALSGEESAKDAVSEIEGLKLRYDRSPLPRNQPL
jgi:hypothetical protein